MNKAKPILDSEILLAGYRMGIFPMAIDEEGNIGWFSPDPRALIPLDDRFHVPHGLRRSLRRGAYEVTADRAFEKVIHACAESRGETWISAEIIRSYTQLHREGHAHSVEVWGEGKLAGGLYGVNIGGAFFGESMFHWRTDASKVALVALVERLRAGGFLLLDTQWTTRHLAQFGTYEITRREYLRLLRAAVDKPCHF